MSDTAPQNDDCAPVDKPTARLLIGDVFDRLAEIPDGSIDLVLTSPPFLALRSYLPADHPDKVKEIGTEPSPADFIDTLLALTAEFRRVLAPHGSIAIELGDTYAGSGGAGGDYGPDGLRQGQPVFEGSAAKHRSVPVSMSAVASSEAAPLPRRQLAGWPMDKSLCGIPHLFHLSLAYGRNILTGDESKAGSWRVRNVIAWCRPNPPVGRLGDKFRPATSFLTIACLDRKRYFDLDGVRAPAKYGIEDAQRPTLAKNYDAPGQPGRKTRAVGESGRINSNPLGAPPLDWWEIPTQPYKGAHYATWPTKLLDRPIRAMVPERVCTTCGKPSERIVGRSGALDASRPQAARAMELAEAGGLTMEHFAAIRSFGIHDAGKAKVTQTGAGRNSDEVKRLAGEAKEVLGGYFREYLLEVPTTIGWTDCGHNSWRPGVVLDPFAGSGTTLAVATSLGRSSVGIDLDARNVDLARQRVGMFLDVDYGEPCGQPLAVVDGNARNGEPSG